MKTCLNCGKLLYGKNKKNNTYCDNKCHSDYIYKTFISNWKLGIEDGMSGKFSISAHIRRYLFDKYGNKCSRCGWGVLNTHTGKIPLEIEHIDGDYMNNRESNLDLVCPNCHSLTSTYKGANRGNGRAGRDDSKKPKRVSMYNLDNLEKIISTYDNFSINTYPDGEINGSTLIKINCNCGNVFDITFSSLMKRKVNDCPNCKANVNFVKEYLENQGKFKILNPEDYINNSTICNYKCLNCGKEIKSSFKNIKKRVSCDICINKHDVDAIVDDFRGHKIKSKTMDAFRISNRRLDIILDFKNVNHVSKLLTRDNILFIRKSHTKNDGDMTTRDLCEKFNVARSVIYKIASGITYKNIK